MSNETSNKDQKVLTRRRLRVSIVVIARVIARVVIAAIVIAGVIARVVIAGVITRVVIAPIAVAPIAIASILVCIRRDGISRRCLNGGTGWQSDGGRLGFTPVLACHVVRTSSDLVQSWKQESK